VKPTHLETMIENVKRDKKVCALAAKGMTHEAIGKLYGFTKQWAWAICKRNSVKRTAK